MSPVTHWLASGVLAGLSGLERRERIVIMLAGVVPDLDGLGAAVELLTRHTAHPLYWFSEYHHQLHTLLFAAACAAIAAILCRARLRTAFLVLLAFHLHLFCDLVGARGPDGDRWPIPYLSPLSGISWEWSGQWALDGWQNFLITGLLLLATGWIAVRKENSPLELFSVRANRTFVETLQRRFRTAE